MLYWLAKGKSNKEVAFILNLNVLQLSRVPCTELKVDRAFVNGASESQHLRILLESALDIASKLGLGVVAEGVEIREDWMLLSDLGCGEVQGYFIAKPMPGDALLAWLRSNETRLHSLAARGAECV